MSEGGGAGPSGEPRFPERLELEEPVAEEDKGCFFFFVLLRFFLPLTELFVEEASLASVAVMER